MVEYLIDNAPAEVQAAFAQHQHLDGFVHTNLAASECECAGVVAKAPVNEQLPDGGICFSCGSMTVRTGTCTTCTGCGQTGGCG